MSKPYLSIVIPNYNEIANLRRGVLDQVNSYLKTAKFSWEVIISDDGASDGSRQLIEAFVKKHKGFRLLKNPHGGKAAAVWSGIKNAKGEIVLFTDMDQSTPLREVEKFLPWYKQGYDVVFGSRGKARQNFALHRQIFSWGFRTFRQVFLLRHVVDTQCGFKSMRTKVAKELFPKLDVIAKASSAKGWVVSAYDVELLHLAERKGYRLKEINVDWQDEDVSTSKSRNFITESVDMAKQILAVKQKELRGEYEV